MRAFTVSVVLGLLSLPLRVSAQDALSPADASRRRSLILDAEAAVRAGNHDLALQRANDAATMLMTPSLRRVIADEHEALGHHRQALFHASTCVQEAQGAPSLNNREAILRRCQDLQDSLRARAAWVRITDVARLPPEAQLILNGEVVRREEMNEELFVLAGGTVLRVETSDDIALERRTSVPQGAHVQVSVPALRSAVVAAPAAGVAAPATVTQHTGPGVLPWVVAGVGVAAIAAGIGVYYGVAVPARDGLNTLCPATTPNGFNACPNAESRRAVDEPTTRWRMGLAITNVAYGVGGAAIVSGLLWYFLSPRSTVTVRTALSTDGAALHVEGRF